MNTSEDTRRKELAKIHIAKKDLVLDDETYRTIVREIGKAESGSAAHLSPLGRARVLQHFRTSGWKSRQRDRQPKRATPAGDVLASEGQVGKIRSFWIQMADAGAVRDRTEKALRAWVRSVTRKHHELKAGWSAPEFLPAWVAQKVIENLKAWAKRCNIKLNE